MRLLGWLRALWTLARTFAWQMTPLPAPRRVAWLETLIGHLHAPDAFVAAVRQAWRIAWWFAFGGTLQCL